MKIKARGLSCFGLLVLLAMVWISPAYAGDTARDYPYSIGETPAIDEKIYPYSFEETWQAVHDFLNDASERYITIIDPRGKKSKRLFFTIKSYRDSGLIIASIIDKGRLDFHPNTYFNMTALLMPIDDMHTSVVINTNGYYNYDVGDVAWRTLNPFKDSGDAMYNGVSTKLMERSDANGKH